MLRPYPNDPRLTGIAIAVRNGAMIADLVLPRVPVGKTSFKWLEFNQAEGMTVPITIVGRKGRPTEVEFTAQEATGSVEDHALDDVVPNDDVADAPPGVDPLGQATEGLANLLLLSREVRVAAKITDPTNYNHTDTLSGTDQFDDPTGDPAALIMDAIQTPFVRPNIAVTNLAVYNALRRHPKIVSALNTSGSTNGMVSGQALADYLELDQILVGEGWINTAKPGQTPTYARVWGNDFALIRRAPVTTTRGEPSFGFTAQFGDRVAKRIDEPKTGLRGAVRVRVGESVGEIIQAKEAGYLLVDAV